MFRNNHKAQKRFINKGSRLFLICGLVVLALNLLAGCGQIGLTQPQASPTNTSEPSPGNTLTAPTVTSAPPANTVTTPGMPSTSLLEQGLTFAPADSIAVSVTDWQFLKQYKNMSNLNSTSPLEERMAFMLLFSKDIAHANIYGTSTFQNHAENWSWDSTDLRWEVTIERQNMAPAHVLVFRDDYNFAQLITHFMERDFTEERYKDVTIYSHKRDFTTEWLQAVPEMAILNTAVLSDQHMLILSADLTNVRTILDARNNQAAALTSVDTARTTARQLGNSVAATILPQACTLLSFNQGMAGQNLSPEQITAMRKRLGIQEIRPYLSFGMGYDLNEGRAMGTIALQYSDAADAQADLEQRRVAADQGNSLMTGQPYNVSVFQLDQASVLDKGIIFKVRPLDNHPELLFQMLNMRDMTFASCP